MSACAASSLPVLLLHGQPGGARDWDRVIAATDGRVRPLPINRPGWDGVSEARDLAGNATAALNALDAAGADRAVIVGHSFGAAVAVRLAADHPDRIAGLVLAAPAANVASLYAVDRLLAAPVVGELGSLLVVGAPALVLRTGFTRQIVGRSLGLSNDHLLAAGRALGRRAALRAFTVEQRSLIRDLPDIEAALPSLRVPTTILIGSRDLIVPVESAHALAAMIRGADLVVLPRAGHLLPLRHPRAIAEAIARKVSAA